MPNPPKKDLRLYRKAIEDAISNAVRQAFPYFTYVDLSSMLRRSFYSLLLEQRKHYTWDQLRPLIQQTPQNVRKMVNTITPGMDRHPVRHALLIIQAGGRDGVEKGIAAGKFYVHRSKMKSSTSPSFAEVMVHLLDRGDVVEDAERFYSVKSHLDVFGTDAPLILLSLQCSPGGLTRAELASAIVEEGRSGAVPQDFDLVLDKLISTGTVLLDQGRRLHASDAHIDFTDHEGVRIEQALSIVNSVSGIGEEVATTTGAQDAGLWRVVLTIKDTQENRRQLVADLKEAVGNVIDLHEKQSSKPVTKATIVLGVAPGIK